MSSLPLGDPQFWIVTLGAVAALGFVLRRRIRVRRKGQVALPCEHCPQAGAHAGATVPLKVKRWLLGEGKSGKRV